MEYNLQKIGKKVDPTEWQMTPQTVNAYYDPTTNEICFPAGILQPPFFDMNADDAANYGAIGVVIGHEMTHGFDDQGRNYDKDGNLSDWWTAKDAEVFKERAQLIVDHFNSIEVAPGVFGNGEFTLGENIADNGGLNVSYSAFQRPRKMARSRVLWMSLLQNRDSSWHMQLFGPQTSVMRKFSAVQNPTRMHSDAGV